MKSWKMRIPDTEQMPRDKKSWEVQHHANKLGYYWHNECGTPRHTLAEFLYFNDGHITYGSCYESFKEDCPYPEITPEQFLALPEKRYRAFHDDEMCKLYGKVIVNNTGQKCLVVGYRKRKNCLLGDLSYIEVDIGGQTLEIPAEGLLNLKFTFPDGTPCGVEVT